MSLIPVSKETLGTKRLKPLTSLSVLSNVPHCEVLGAEFADIAANYPIFFVQRETVFIPIALFAVSAGANLFIDDQGRWDGAYLPAAFRRYPFAISPGESGNDQVLMVEEDMLSDDEGELIFGASQNSDLDPDSIVGRVLRFTAESMQQGQATRRVVDAITAADLILPASETFNVPAGQPFLPGFFSISEKRLNDLSDEKFLDLRRQGALPLIYLQLASLGQLGRLRIRHAARTGQPLPAAGPHAPASLN